MQRMFSSFLHRWITYPGTSWFVFCIISSSLAVAGLRSWRRSEGKAAAIYVLALFGFLTFSAIRTPTPPFNAARFPFDLYISQPDSSILKDPVRQVVFGRHVLRIHTPSEMSWSLKGSERELSFEYGYIPQAYLEGRPEGAAFVVEVLHDASVRKIFQRNLAPFSQSPDRKPQFSRVILPPFQAGDRLVLRLDSTNPADHTRNWIYVGNIKFNRSSHFLPSQFPSFGTLPSKVSAPSGLLYQKDGHATFLQLDAPSRLIFQLTGAEKRLAFSYGMLPGAYQNGGNTDGADFRVELQEADGTPNVLFERRLQPVAAPGDRGRQYQSVNLPHGHRGARMTVVIDPGPAKNDSWDWTYVNRLTLE